MTARTISALLVILALATSSCSIVPTKSVPGEPGYRISKILINESITIPSSKTRVFFQHGNIESRFDHYEPNCNIEVRLRDDENIQTIKPSEFNITSIKEYYEEVVNLKLFQKTKLAQLNILANRGIISFLNNDYYGVYRGYHFYLSGQDTNIYRLSCRGAYAPSNEAMLPTFSEMKQSLGDIIHFY